MDTKQGSSWDNILNYDIQNFGQKVWNMYVSITLFISGYMIILQHLIDSIESSNLQFDELRVTERNIAVIAWLIRL